MSRPQKIALYKKANTWYVRFQLNGERQRKSLQTSDEVVAKEIVKDLLRLMKDPGTITHPTAHTLFFGEKQSIEAETSKEKIIRQIRKYDEVDSDIYILGKLAERCDILEAQNAQLLEQNQKLNDELNALKTEKETKLLTSYRQIPTFAQVFPEYAQSVKHLDQGGALHTRLIEKLLDHHNCSNMKITEIQPRHISDFLQNKFFKGNDPAEAWNRQRRILHRFWRWLSVNHNIENIIVKVETKKQKPKIIKNWHTIEEVEKELKNHTTYWQAIIATMAYAGLSAHEVRGLKMTDYDGNYIIVQPHQERQTKSTNRIRKVYIHAKYLKPRLEAYLKIRKKSEYLFPSETFGSEQWQTHTFSRHLGKTIQTEGMNALSLRRTFGSLLLRDGKTESEVAAAMGNTSTMVRQHYAKLFGSEIEIKF